MNFAKQRISLSISCVFYDTPSAIINSTIETLYLACNHAKKLEIISHYSLYLINNNPIPSHTFQNAVTLATEKFDHLYVLTDHGNIGYGRGNNLAIKATKADYHLILNPDVAMDVNSLAEGVTFLNTQPDVGLVAPNASNQKGEIEYLAKRMPSIWVIILRGINRPFINNLFQLTLDKYCYKDRIPSNNPIEIELASGCFMLCRTSSLTLAGGFSEDYFLYFEDFDLSRKISKTTKIIHHPLIKITHIGGNTARKGLKHIFYFLKSAVRFLLV